MEATNPTNLALDITLPTLALADAAGLKTWALGIKEKYSGLVILEDQTVSAKAEVAELRRIAKQLNDSRVAAVKQVSAPIKDFEAQVKEVAGIFLETADGIDAQVKNFETQAREIKRQEVLTSIAILTEEAGYPGLEIPVQDSWCNKSQKPTQTAADIQAFIMRHMQAENAAKAIEQAKKDRAVAIEQHSAGQGAAFGFNIPASEFLALNNLELPLGGVLTCINAAYTVKAATMKRENVAPVPVPAPDLDAFGRKPLPLVRASDVPELKGKTVHLEYDARNENEVLALLDSLRAICTDFVWLSKPLATMSQANQSSVQRPY